MPKHVKPTTEELDAGADKALAEAEKIKAEEEENKPPEENVDENPPEDKPEEEHTEEKPPEPDYKEKFKQSSKEALIQRAKAEGAQAVTKAIEDAATITDIPEDVLKKEYPEWDDMTATEQRLAKESYINRQRFDSIHKAASTGKDIQAWNDKVDSFVEDPKTLVDNPALEGKTDDFRIFATQPTRRGVDFGTLIAAFLYDATKVPEKKGKMFEEGTGGDNEKPKPKTDKISAQQARALRVNDYPKYKELLLAGKIETDLE